LLTLATALGAGQKLAWPGTPCHGDVFHIHQQFETLVNIWVRIASGVRSQREALEARLANPRRRCQDHPLVAELVALRQLDARSSQRADDLRTLAQWLERDILTLAGPERAARQDLFDFIVDELHRREAEDPSRIGTMRVALKNQRDDLLAFASVLDDKLAAIARAATVPDFLVRATCLLHRRPDTSGAFWQGWNRLHAAMGRKFYGVWMRSAKACWARHAAAPWLKTSTRGCATADAGRHLNGGRAWLGLLQFFINHRRFVRSRRGKRLGKSLREAMTGEDHPHWLMLLGLGPLQPRQN
jgi:hypothetical protein